MRVLTFFISLCFLLLCGGHSYSAIVQPTHRNFVSKDTLTKSRPIKYSNKGQSTILIEETDIDVEEEHTGNDLKDESASKVLSENSKVLNKWYSKVSYLFFLNQYYKSFSMIPHLSGPSNPIYITQGVLRL